MSWINLIGRVFTFKKRVPYWTRCIHPTRKPKPLLHPRSATSQKIVLFQRDLKRLKHPSRTRTENRFQDPSNCWKEYSGLTRSDKNKNYVPKSQWYHKKPQRNSQFSNVFHRFHRLCTCIPKAMERTLFKSRMLLNI